MRFKVMKAISSFIFLLLLSALNAQAQDTSAHHTELPNKITIVGKVLNENGESTFQSLFVVNRRTRTGNFAESSGLFRVTINSSDTLMIGAMGYGTKYLSFQDSVPRDTYNVKVLLLPLQIELEQVDIFAPRTLREIFEEVEKLGYDERDDLVRGVNAVQSPITALYMAFSRRERRKREAMRVINEDKKRDLLKELFQKFVHHDIIDLDNDEFDDFIDYCNVNEEFMKTATQYEFIMFIKHRYKNYRRFTKYDDYSRD